MEMKALGVTVKVENEYGIILNIDESIIFEM